jgi:uncharacterized protein (TIGR03067 family)
MHGEPHVNSSNLPPRPNLDHLRRQAKALLAALATADADAVLTFRRHLPAAKDMTDDQVRTAGFRLADAQSAVARQTGFASWPQLARHVEQLRALEGTWSFASLEVEGHPMPPATLATSRLLIDGDRFRTETPGAAYEGIFNIDVETDPHGIDIEFVEGPEAGNTNHGIFRLDADQLDICLDMTGKARPPAFRTAPGSHQALETLRRTSAARPDSVTGGTPQPRPDAAPAQANAADFAYAPSPTLTRLQGEWSALKLVHNGQEVPSAMCATGRRSATNNELKVCFGGQLMIHALVRINETTNPIEVDYYNLAGPAKGTIQHGIMQWVGDEACFCMSAPGTPRPTDFTCPAGSGHTLSQWRPAKK